MIEKERKIITVNIEFKFFEEDYKKIKKISDRLNIPVKELIKNLIIEKK